MMKKMSRKVIGYIALALACVVAGTAIGVSQPAAQADTVVLTSPFTEAIAKVRDSVVGVYNYQIVNNYGYGSGYGYDYFPWEYFGFGYGGGNGYGYGNGRGGRQQPQQPETSEVKYASGSGVVIAKEYVLTNYHVIDGSSSLKISVGGDDSNLYEATPAASDPDIDVAVLYVPGLPLEPVEIGDSDQLVVGDWAINIGNAIGFNGTVTAGIISALDREIESEKTQTDRFGRKSNTVNKMIQTDAAINSGNSGGGMFNTAGQLVGIPTLKYSGTRYSGAAIESIGMCIPINEAKGVINEALNADKPQAGGETGIAPIDPDGTDSGNQAGSNDRTGKPRLGVSVTTLQTQGQLPNGAYILAVEAGSPADKAGLKAGDTIVEVNGTVISSTSELMNALEPYKEGDTVKLTVWRPDEVKDAESLDISLEGQYMEDIQVSLAMLDNVKQ